MSNKISDKDKKDWENFLSNNEFFQDKDLEKKETKVKKTSTFDLHGFSLEEANLKIKDLIYNAYNNHINKLIIVTGKGLHSNTEKDPYVSKHLGILKYSVPAYIKNSDELMSMISDIRDAEIEDGGKGAFYIFFYNKFLSRINK